MLKQKAEEGLQLLQDAVIELLAQHPQGLKSSHIARELGLGSDYQGQHQGWLCWSIMGLLLNSRKVEKHGHLYRLPVSDGS
jgi:hypothetical protein